MRKSAWFLLVGLCLLPLTAYAEKPQAAPAAEEEEIEEIEEVEVVEATPASATPAKPAEPTLLEKLGRMHPAFVHMPIAWVVLLLLVELLGLALGRESFAKVGLPLAVLALASYLPAGITGMINYSFKPDGWTAHELAELHRNLIWASGGVLALAVGLRVALRQRFNGAIRWPYLALVLTATGLISYAGHLGGTLVFGESYLPF